MRECKNQRECGIRERNKTLHRHTVRPGPRLPEADKNLTMNRREYTALKDGHLHLRPFPVVSVLPPSGLRARFNEVRPIERDHRRQPITDIQRRDTDTHTYIYMGPKMLSTSHPQWTQNLPKMLFFFFVYTLAVLMFRDFFSSGVSAFISHKLLSFRIRHAIARGAVYVGIFFSLAASLREFGERKTGADGTAALKPRVGRCWFEIKDVKKSFRSSIVSATRLTGVRL